MSPEANKRPGRNDPCHCGSGRKYKHCHLDKDEAKARAARAKAAEAAPPPASEDPAPQTAQTARTPKHQTDQPWKARTTRGFVPKARLPRKVGGS
jgi:hypothetical protein